MNTNYKDKIMNNDRNDDRNDNRNRDLNRNNDRNQNLKELSGSDYKIAEDQPKIDGWKILDHSGRKVGKVKDLLFDESAMKVRYIVTNLKKGDLLDLDDDRLILIPIGQAQLDTENDRVVVPNINHDAIAGLPHYEKVDDLTREDETRFRNCFAGTSTGDYNREKFYDHEHYDEERFYAGNKDRRRNTDTSGKVDVVEENIEVGKRKVDTGGARISSRIVERPVEERVKLKEEHVQVKRDKVDRPADSADLENFKNRTVEEHETSEVPVVNKEARVVEEVSLEKDVDTREEVVRENVRKTKVDVDNLEGENRNKGVTGTGDRDRDNLAREQRNRDGDVEGRENLHHRDRTRGKDKRNEKS